MIEFLLVGIPLLFLILAIVQMSLGMWTYNMLANTVDEAARYASIKSGTLANPTCRALTPGTVGYVTCQIQTIGPGLIPSKLTIVLADSTGTSVHCSPVTAANCLNSISPYPATAAVAFVDTVMVTGTYPFATPIAIFWPTAGPMQLAGNITVGASSTQLIQ
jgi:Flp pilus assembly protein TadG